MNINITPFDNNISILYKWADKFNIPIRLVLVETEEEFIYSNGLVAVATDVGNKTSLEDIIELYPSLNVEDIAMIYYNYSQETIDEKLETINQLYQLSNIDLLRDANELKLLSDEWVRLLPEALADDRYKLETIEIIHEELSKYPSFLVSPLEIDKAVLVTYPIVDEDILIDSMIDGISMFDKSRVSKVLPYIKYNGDISSSPNRLELFKLFKGSTIENQPDYTLIIPPEAKVKKDDSIYFTVWSGAEETSKTTKESYITGSYNLETNKLSVKTPLNTNKAGENVSDIVINRITSSLPITIDDIQKTSISGSFYIFGVDFNDIYLVDMILNSDLMSSYLYVNEISEPYSNKKQVKLYYKTLDLKEEASSSVALSITQFVSKGGEVVQTLTPSYPSTNQYTQKTKLTANYPYIKVRITQAESIEVANQFIFIFSKLLNYYQNHKDEVARVYTIFIPELLEETKILSKAGVTGKVRADTKMERLHRAIPDLFLKGTEGYARKVQCNTQPIIIQSDEVEAWENKTFLYKGKERKRNTMTFPDDPRWIFVCPGDEYPFPGFKENDLLNKDIYPCLPKCFKSDKSYSSRGNCFKKKKVKIEGSQRKKTNKILAPGGYGFLPRNISNLISKYSEESKDITRLGIPHTVNSLLHCVSVAIRDPRYLELKNEEKEQYVSGIRHALVNSTIPSLMKQEMYDYTDEEIMSQFSNPEIFLDPNLFYRAIEKGYKINLYVFSPHNDRIFEYPRFKLFHSRVPNPKNTSVLIYRTWGSESDNLSYPQCELIIDRDEEKDRNLSLFSPEMTTFMHNSMVNLNRTITWIPEEVGTTTTLTAKDNIYSRINYNELFKNQANGQIIDGYGKLRGLTFMSDFIVPELPSEEVTAIFMSSQPENLEVKEMTRCSDNIAIGILGIPVAVTIDKNNLVDGFWYNTLDIVHGIYIPIKPIDKYKEISIGPDNPLVATGINITSRLFKMNRDLEIILQVTVWLYQLSKTDVTNFANNYIYYGEDKVEDSSTIYDLNNIGRQFPEAETYLEGVAELRKRIPTLFLKDRLYLYSKTFFKGVVYYLSKYDKSAPIDTLIRRSNLIPEDFIIQPYTALFTNEINMKIWLNTLNNMSFDTLKIDTVLNKNKRTNVDPYMYMASSGNIYLIQNVLGGELSRAIEISLSWYTNKINPGYTSQQYEKEYPVHVIYSIGPSNDIMVEVDKSGGSPAYLQILNYGTNTYAALLRLL